MNNDAISLSPEELPTANTLRDISVVVPVNTLEANAQAAVPDSQMPVTSRPQLDSVIAHRPEEPYHIRVRIQSLRSIPYM